jgi:hypothetical protein
MKQVVAKGVDELALQRALLSTCIFITNVSAIVSEVNDVTRCRAHAALSLTFA